MNSSSLLLLTRARRQALSSLSSSPSPSSRLYVTSSNPTRKALNNLVAAGSTTTTQGTNPTKKNIVVQKYGGTSLGTSEKLEKVMKIVTSKHKPKEGGDHVVAVVSALSSETKAEGTTTRLLNAAEAAVQQKDFNVFLDRIEDTHMDALYGIMKGRAAREEVRGFVTKELSRVREFCTALGTIREISPRSHDMIIGCGERLSAGLIAGILRDQGVDARYVNLSNAFTELNTHRRGYQGEARNVFRNIIQPIIDEGALPVCTGYFGNIKGGIIHGVGRGYTDLTAALVAGAVDARVMEVWKESDGVFEANPTRIKEASLVGWISPAEAAELTAFGNEVLHQFTMSVAIEANVPISILNTFKPTSPGTVVKEFSSEPAKRENELASRPGSKGIVAICSKKNIPVLNVSANGTLDPAEFLNALFEVLKQNAIRVDLVSSSISQVSLALHETTSPAQIEAVTKELEEFSNVKLRTSRSIVSCVGEGMAHQVGVAAQVFSCLGEAGISIEMLSQGVSEITIAAVIDQKDEEKAIRALHKRFFGSDAKKGAK